MRSSVTDKDIDMRHTLPLVAALAALIIPALPATAQQQDRVLTIYGDDKCPTNTSGEQIVVCSRKPEAERFRIPKELRSPLVITPQNESWAARANSTLNAGAATGTGSCSAVGSGGWTGCWAQQMRATKAERRQEAQAEGATP